jgi:hypothetical protein
MSCAHLLVAWFPAFCRIPYQELQHNNFYREGYSFFTNLDKTANNPSLLMQFRFDSHLNMIFPNNSSVYIKLLFQLF